MIVEGGRKYNVRLIPQTCNREDAIREIVSALDHLNAISDEIFSGIRNRLSRHREQVQALSSRVAAASEQVSTLKGTQKAIRIISPAKFPCELPNNPGNSFEHLTFPALVSKYVPAPHIPGHDVDENGEMKRSRPFRFDTPIKHPNDLLSVFHVKEPKLGDLGQLDDANVGLGKPPPTIRNMDSFFLFNTVDNPYQNYKMTDRSLQDRNFGTLKPTRKGEEVHADVCPTVPNDNEKGAESKIEIDDFYYNPSALEIPDIDVPDSLPDLPGIAESFDLTEDLMSPTFASKPFSLSSVPIKTANKSPSGAPTTVSSVVQNKEDAFLALQTSTPDEKSKSFETPSAAPKTNVGPNVPPPPPPPPPPPAPTTPKGESKASVPASSAAGGDLHSSLMAAIRDAGGSGNARLRSAKDKKYEAKKKKQEEKGKNLISDDLQEGGDLMADLKNTLAMRRRGISGIPDSQKRAGVGEIMLSLAATIPTIDNSMESSTGAAGGSDEDDWD